MPLLGLLLIGALVAAALFLMYRLIPDAPQFLTESADMPELLPSPTPRKRGRVFLWIVIAMLVLVLGPIAATIAHAATVQPSTTVTIPPEYLSELNELVIGIVVALLTMLYKWLDSKSPLKNTQAEAIARDAFNTLLNNAAKYGMSQMSAAEKNVGTIDVGNPAVAAAANFAIAHGPDLAAKMGFDVSTPEGRAAIIRSVTLRVADLAAPGSAAPAVIQLPAAVQPNAAAPVPKNG